MTFPERDVRLMVEDLAITRGRVHKRVQVRELAASHNLEQMQRVCVYVCMIITYSRVWINRVRLPILLVVS